MEIQRNIKISMTPNSKQLLMYNKLRPCIKFTKIPQKYHLAMHASDEHIELYLWIVLIDDLFVLAAHLNQAIKLRHSCLITSVLIFTYNLFNLKLKLFGRYRNKKKQRSDNFCLYKTQLRSPDMKLSKRRTSET